MKFFLRRKNISLNYFSDFFERQLREHHEKLGLLVNMMGRIYTYDKLKHITFTDGEWVSEPGPLCDQFVKENLMFVVSSSSRKHSYRSYYFRIWPFDLAEFISNLIVKHLNIEGLTDEEWRIISLLLFSQDLALEYQSIKDNVSLTDAELREILTGLRERGLIDEKYGKASSPQVLKEPLTQFFKLNIYPKIKSETVNNLKLKISKRLSNFWVFATVKRIYELPQGETSLNPVPTKYINKSDLKEHEQHFRDMRELGLIFDFRDKIVVLADLVKEIENWLRSSLKPSLIFIPARDFYLARATLQNIFLKCQDYVKIQDPYLGEETFDVLEYISKDLEIKFLTSMAIGVGEDFDRVCQYIERIKAERRGKFHILFLGNPSGDAPFHDRFIISKNSCWQIGTSLKQIGKGKDTTIIEISKREKDEMVEPAFDKWWGAKEKELIEKNLKKLDFRDWEKFKKSEEL